MIANGAGNFIKTFYSLNDAVLPGHIVTQTGGSQKGVDWPDGADDDPVGVVLCLPGQDVDTAYAAGTTFPVAMCGSSAEVWVRFKTSGGALTAGQGVMEDSGTANGLALAAAAEGAFENIGRATHWHDDIASESWVAVRLSL